MEEDESVCSDLGSPLTKRIMTMMGSIMFTEAIELRMLYVHNVPESVTEDALKELVPEALSAIIPKDDDRKSKG